MPRHLSARVYHTLQSFVHRGHRDTVPVLVRLLELPPGATVLEVGCGTGSLAAPLLAAGYDYWGVDRDAGRIAAARRAHPRAHFLVGDALALGRLPLPPVRWAFIHGVLHHLDDADCQVVLDGLLALGRDVTVAVSEPCMPTPWWRNVPGALAVALDEGRFVRSSVAWQALFGPRLVKASTRSLWPRWPVPFLDARLAARATPLVDACA
jgi:SAM-dependent methyltransferase